MPDKNLVKQTPLLRLFELLGKPIFFLFTILGVLLVTYLHLLTIFVHRLFTTLKQFRLPHLFSSNIRFSIKIQNSKFIIGYLILLFTLVIGVLAYWYILKDLPDPHLLTTSLPSLSTKIYDRHGVLLYQIYRDENRTLVKLTDLPPHLISATVASEDQSFYSHPGISLSGISRALINNIVNCKLEIENCNIQGGSTLTQQLVKNAFLSPERTLVRKLKEIVLAIQTERIYSKDQILEFYFNYVPYGGTAYGIQEGARYYFDKSASDLNLSESALLAGLPVAPTTLSPFGTNPFLAKHRQDQILDQMVKENYLTPENALAAKNAPLIFRARGNGILAPHFVMYVQDLLVKQYGEDMVHRGGLAVTTTLDLNLQSLLENNITDELARLTSLNVSNGAGLILSPQSGEILAMVGSRDFFDSDNDGQVNVTLSPRQPGSAIKPLTYTLALENGLTPATMLDDSPVCFTAKGQSPYCPANYDGRFHGPVTLRTALASSYNIPAIKLLNSLGVGKLIKLGHDLGLTTWDNPARFGLALTLGGGEVKLLELAGAYAAFARGGSYLPPTAILTVTNHSSLPPITPPTPTQLIAGSIAYQISDILSDNRARAPAFGSNSVLNIKDHQVAVKTGTSNDLRDNWTLGYTSDYLVAIWVGNNDNTPMSRVASGITGASPIWSRTMQTLLSGSPPHTFSPPDNLARINLSCTGTPRWEYFVPGTEPKVNCQQPEGEIL